MSRVVFLTGGNEGDVEAALGAARGMVEERVGRVVFASSVRRSAPWGVFDAPQQEFLNQILVVETALKPLEVLDATQGIERELGRRNGELKIENGKLEWERRVYSARPIDIDILYYDDVEMSTPRLTIPHPRIGEREFVRVLLEELPQELKAGRRQP